VRLYLLGLAGDIFVLTSVYMMMPAEPMRMGQAAPKR